MKKYVFQLPYDVARENSFLQCVQCVQCLDFLEVLAVIASYGKSSTTIASTTKMSAA